MPLPKGYQVFPAGYDELEAHVAGMCACVVFTGNPDADDLSIAAFERLFHEEAEKNPTVPPSVIAANILTYIERDMSIERVDFVGSPLRVTWFVLGYHAWVLIAVRCGRVHLEDDAVSEIRVDCHGWCSHRNAARGNSFIRALRAHRVGSVGGEPIRPARTPRGSGDGEADNHRLPRQGDLSGLAV